MPEIILDNLTVWYGLRIVGCKIRLVALKTWRTMLRAACQQTVKYFEGKAKCK